MDSQNRFVPEFFRQPAPPSKIEQPPDIAAILHRDLMAVFSKGSHPVNVRFSLPIPTKYGGWDTCIRASVTGVTGRQIGEQTYLVTIDHDQIGRRELVDDKHRCGQEKYESL